MLSLRFTDTSGPVGDGCGECRFRIFSLLPCRISGFSSPTPKAVLPRQLMRRQRMQKRSPPVPAHRLFHSYRTILLGTAPHSTNGTLYSLATVRRDYSLITFLSFALGNNPSRADPNLEDASAHPMSSISTCIVARSSTAAVARPLSQPPPSPGLIISVRPVRTSISWVCP